MVDVAIVGGGLAGLVNAILLARHGFSVKLFEKKEYPFHRVCGEYISNEVTPFLKRNDLYPDHVEMAQINKFMLSSTNGNSAELSLGMGGFGISRFTLDHFLSEKAKEAGVDISTNTSVDDITYQDDFFNIKVGKEQIESRIVIGAFGKRSNLDKKLQRKPASTRSPYLAVKYHLKTDFPSDMIALHNFNNGYCGISKVEGDTYNLCYLSHRNNLKVHHSIPEMEKEILHKNPFLKEIFDNAEFLFDAPLVINEISFDNKLPVENHVLMSGDSAGMITPLCGNGMAMAIHSAKLLSDIINRNFKDGKVNKQKVEAQYTRVWKQTFGFRLSAGRRIQALFGSENASNLGVFLAGIKPIGNSLVRLTHGKEF
ncbi:MAG: NAD(P)/FAD-dependent oxidoreductase [Cyclobacteriaceae bacterium]